MTKRAKRLLDAVRETIRLKHYSPRTAEAYVYWTKRYVLFHDKRHPREMGVREIESFLTHLAMDEQVAASTQNQALSALLFLYRHVLKNDLECSIAVVRAKRPQRLPTVLTREEVLRVIGFLKGKYRLMAKLLYANREWPWQYVFPASKLSRNPRTGMLCRHYIHESALQAVLIASQVPSWRQSRK